MKTTLVALFVALLGFTLTSCRDDRPSTTIETDTAANKKPLTRRPRPGKKEPEAIKSDRHGLERDVAKLSRLPKCTVKTQQEHPWSIPENADTLLKLLILDFRKQCGEAGVYAFDPATNTLLTQTFEWEHATDLCQKRALTIAGHKLTTNENQTVRVCDAAGRTLATLDWAEYTKMPTPQGTPAVLDTSNSSGHPKQHRASGGRSALRVRRDSVRQCARRVRVSADNAVEGELLRHRLAALLLAAFRFERTARASWRCTRCASTSAPRPSTARCAAFSKSTEDRDHRIRHRWTCTRSYAPSRLVLVFGFISLLG